MANPNPPKPRHHGRDHLPGGEDPIPDLATLFAYNPNSAEEHLNVATTTIAAITSTQVNWTHYAWTSLLDLTTANAPKVVTDGIYGVGVSVQVTPPAVEPAGDGIDIALLAVQPFGFPPGTPSPSRATFVNAGNSQSVWYAEAHMPVVYLRAGLDSMRLSVVNHNSYSVDVVAGIRVVRIIEL